MRIGRKPRRHRAAIDRQHPVDNDPFTFLTLDRATFAAHFTSQEEMSIMSRVLMRALSSLVVVLIVGQAHAQIPTKCLEIESILVDACNPSALCAGSSEGQNEMVRFRVGPEPIAIGDLEADWPNNTWRGLVQNATTASITSQLNATIASCGLLIEPSGGIIPAGSSVLLITSTEMCVAGNSFAALTDTLYIVFQDAGNTSGHFANSTVAGQPISPIPPEGDTQRTLILFHNASGCSDTATYVRELLLNNVGSYGGEAGESDGGTVEFSWPGVPVANYVNFGCQAPFSPLFVEAEAVGQLCGGTGTVDISAQVIGGAFTSVLWSGGTGTFGDPTALVTTYTAGPGDVGTVTLTLCAQTDCADPICGSVNVPSGSGPTITISANGPLAICPGEEVQLTASGADSYSWSSGEVSASIAVSTPGTYTVTGTDVCGTGQATVEVTAGNGVVVTITGNTALCPGESTTLTANGATNYLWSTGELTPSISVSSTGSYSVTGSNACGSSTESVTVSLGVAPSVSIAGTATICAGSPATLTATSNGAVVWSTGATTNSITVTTAGTYSATATNSCGSTSASFVVTESPGPTVAITGVLSLCDGASTTLTASGADTYVWSTGASGSTITVSAPGAISVTGTNACGSDDATVTVGQSPAPTISVSGGGTLCPGEQLVLTATSNATVTWNTGASGSTLTVTNAGLYVATASNACGTDSDAQQVTLSPLTASFTASPTVGTAPLTVQFTNTSAQAATNTWDLGGEGTSSSASPSFTFTEPGNYLVTLVTTADDCVAEADELIIVTAPGPGTTSVITVPNVFTPNGDRVNDVLVLDAVNIVSMEVFIYNRWGQKVNELKRVGEVWDARSMSGNLVPDGTYFYTLTAQGTDGVTHDLSGHITVVR